MEIPEKLKVGPIEYRVRESDSIIDSDGNHVGGKFDFFNQEIQVFSRASGDAKMQLFLHSMICAIRQHIGASYDVCETSTRDADSLATALLMVVKDNPGLFALDTEVSDTTVRADDRWYSRRKMIVIDGVPYIPAVDTDQH